MLRPRHAVRCCLFALLSLASARTIAAEDSLLEVQHKPWQPEGAVIIPLWPAGTALTRTATSPELYGFTKNNIAGKPSLIVEQVAEPTVSVFAAKGTNTGTAMLVFPGGGYKVLAVDLEGTEICDWLTAKGVTCAVLKYRSPNGGPHYDKACDCGVMPKVPMALQDAQRAMRILRARTTEFGIDPHRIGVVGFSAGGHLVANISNHLASSYKAVDAIDTQSARPDFAMVLYPGHLWKEPGLTLKPDIKVDPKGPPALIVQAGDDPVDDTRESLTYYLALQQAQVPAEYHAYPQGGHAFGVRPTDLPITHWPALAEAWMARIGMLPAK